jgi:hypothetical protein
MIACKDKTPDYAGMRPFKKKEKPNNISPTILAVSSQVNKKTM